MMANLFQNFLWKYGERLIVQLVNFVVSIILARLLLPEDYGAVAMVMVFINLANVLIDGGFNSALIQKKHVDDLDYSSVLYFSILFSLILYTLLFIAAPSIASFYGPEYQILTSVLRVLGIQIIILSINSVQQAYVSRHMLFKNFFLSSSIGTGISAIVGITLAYWGYGIWALVAQQLLMVSLNLVTLFLVTRKLPILRFSFTRLRALFSYGANILGASLLMTGYQEVRALVIGRLYSASSLAYFDKGRQFPNLIVNNIIVSIGTVLFPKLAQFQDNPVLIKQYTRQSIRTTAFIMTPLMLGLLAASKPLVLLLLTEKWLPCVPLLQLFCILNLFQPLHTANLQAIKAIGRSDIFFLLEIVKKTIDLIVLLLVIRISVYAIVLSMSILCGFFTVINAYPNIKLLGYTYKEQYSDLLPSFSCSIIMLLCIYYINKLSISPIMVLSLQVVLGVIIYYISSNVLNNRELCNFVNIIKKIKG